MENCKSKQRVVMAAIIKNIALTALFVFAVFSAAHFYNTAIKVREKGFMDTPMFLYQAGFFINSGKLYTNPLKEGAEIIDGVIQGTESVKAGGELEGFQPLVPWYKFPPAYLLAYMPWVPLVDPNFEEYTNTIMMLCKEIWVVHVIRYLLALVVIIMLLNGKGSVGFFLGGMSMGLLFTPFFESLSGLNFDNLLFFSLVMIILLGKIKNNELSGVVIGVVSMLKLYPAILILWAVAVRNIKIVFYFLGTCFLLLWLSLLVFGLENHKFFYARLLPLLLNETSLSETTNLSLGYFFVHHWKDSGVAMQYFDFFRKSMLAVTFILLWVHGKCRGGCTRFAAIKLSLLSCVMLIYLPNYWWNYQLVLILPVLALLAGAYAAPESFWQGVVAAVCWLVMVCSGAGNGEYLPLYLRENSYVVNVVPGYCPYIPLILWFAMALALITYKPEDSRAPGLKGVQAINTRLL